MTRLFFLFVLLPFLFSTALAAPPTETWTGDPIILGKLSKGTLSKKVDEHREDLWKCYTDEQSKSPKLFGKIVVKFVIKNDGSVSSATTKASTMKNPLVERCLNETFLAMTFSAFDDGIVIISQPFTFNPPSS